MLPYPSSVAVDAAVAQLYVGGGYSLLHYFAQCNGSWALNRSLSSTFYPYGLALSSATSSLFIANDPGAAIRLDATAGAPLSRVNLNDAYGATLDSSGSLLVST